MQDRLSAKVYKTWALGATEYESFRGVRLLEIYFNLVASQQIILTYRHQFDALRPIFSHVNNRVFAVDSVNKFRN